VKNAKVNVRVYVKSLQLLSHTKVDVAKRPAANLAAETKLVPNTQLHPTYLPQDTT